jgi:peptidoglycan/xylan/chitin deacetylase (PgdA/CDA1 family)
MKPSIPILLYHHVSLDREITPAGFDRQLRFLLDQGYRSLSMDELLDQVEGRRPLEDLSFAVTFDDGYRDVWAYAFPILQKLGVKATIYVVTERMEAGPTRSLRMALDTRSREREPGGFLAWSEAREMAASGLVTIGSHTHTHRRFDRKQIYQNLEEELRFSKTLIEREVARPCHHLSWPWGDYDKAWWPLLKEIDYRSAVTTRMGANTLGTLPYALKRFTVSREDLRWLSARVRWTSRAWPAAAFGFFYGWDRRIKSKWHSESPYPHG